MLCGQSAYAQVGGMNQRKGGEDFYFINKLLNLGRYYELTSTTVYPSPRESNRVPFGTGKAVGDLLKQKTGWRTYQIESFLWLQEVINLLSELYHAKNSEMPLLTNNVHPALMFFLQQCNWQAKVEEIKRNVSSEENFKKRFYQWLDPLLLVKYFNSVHDARFQKQPVLAQAKQLLQHARLPDIDRKQNLMGTLEVFRGLDKQKISIFT
ncbi:MAG: hypothetical protein HC896_15090 [Bacteroidales bacterium]|nr:hypothetical protein [Bacteroidales bacterium]